MSNIIFVHGTAKSQKHTTNPPTYRIGLAAVCSVNICRILQLVATGARIASTD
jgi:hypothetical protein